MGIKKIRAPRMAWAILGISLITAFPSRRVAGDGMFRLQGHVPIESVRKARYLGERGAAEAMKLAIVLKPRDQAGLDELLRRLHDPQDPQYRQFLTPQQFTERFGPGERDVAELRDHLARAGLRVTEVHPNRLVVDVEGPTSAVEDAFQLRMNSYQLADGRVAHAANADPIFPAALAAKVQAVAGLDDFHRRTPHVKRLANAVPATIVPERYMTPAKIRSAYDLGSITQTGAGETLALFELDGYDPNDITAYTNYFGLPAPNLENVLVDGFSGAPGKDALEVTLDIELALAVAPALKILVYEGPNSDPGCLDIYSRIANDNIAKVVSTSWGSAENVNTAAFLNGENALFQQMAAQGQSHFVASGDSGAFADGNNPSTPIVDDPASQPYVTAVGGTALTLNDAGNSRSETTWANPRNGSGSGGGISRVWPQPAWQRVGGSVLPGGSRSYRMVPDVAFDADPRTGYPIYMGGWGSGPVGGTSAAAPIWAAFASLVNQRLAASGKARLGFVNPALYQIGQSAQYANAFYDVDDGSTNFQYKTFLGYDMTTGFGSFQGAGLFGILTSGALPAAMPIPGAPSDFTAGVN